jgi:two-component system sensor histidine kinase CpxA
MMRSTFALILVTLLLAFYAILGLTFFFFPPKDSTSPENSGAALKTSLLNEAFLEHEYYLHNGCKPHLVMGEAGTLVKLAQVMPNGFELLCGGKPSPAFTAVLQRAVDTHSLASGPDGEYWVIAYPFRPPQDPEAAARDSQRPGGPQHPEERRELSAGPQLMIAQYSPMAHRNPSPWMKVLIPLAVCAAAGLLLAYSFSRPVQELRSVVRSFASGNLDARVPEAGLRLAAAGSYEIHSLMVDFNQMAERIAGLMEAQKLLLRDVSHELRSPLARLSVALELTRDEAPSTAEVHLQRIEDEANQLNRLIGELLSLSSLESLHSPLAVKSVSLAHLVEELLGNLQFEAQARKCSVTHSVLADPEIVVDAELMGRAIENIARNAIRYSPADGIVELETTTFREDAKDWAILRIMDRGPGVPENMRKAIFRPFVRVDSSRNENTGGFGVGLAIAERAIHLHGGTITASPRPGGGLIVEVRIPIQSKA